MMFMRICLRYGGKIIFVMVDRDSITFHHQFVKVLEIIIMVLFLEVRDSEDDSIRFSENRYGGQEILFVMVKVKVSFVLVERISFRFSEDRYGADLKIC